MWFSALCRSTAYFNVEMPWLLVLLFLAVLDALPVDVACVRLADIYWNSTNPMFRIDNTDHIIDVNKNKVPYEYDQVNIICPVYPPGTHEDDSEKYIIYNVSKEEYDMCTITGPLPRVIAICDKPHRLMYFTITFRPFTPQPGGLEFRPGQDYYFISTSSKENISNRIGGRCLTNNMKVVFKVCCNTPIKTSTPWSTSSAATVGHHVENGLSTFSMTTLSPVNTARPRIRPPTFGPVPPPTVGGYSTVYPRVHGGGSNERGLAAATTSPDFKSIAGNGVATDTSGRGKQGGGGKKATGESKDKQHPNDTGMKIEELVRNSGHGRHRHRWTRTALLWPTTIVLCSLLATVLHQACR